MRATSDRQFVAFQPRVNSTLMKACLRLLRPLARIMLRHGFSTYDFSRVANIAFVQAARDILDEQGRSASFSRISTITGLHRHVVSDIVNSDDGKSGSLIAEKDYQRNRLARVLTGWFESPDYTDSEGHPRILPESGPAPSFATLVQAFSGDIYPTIILEELLQVGAVRRLKDGSLRAVSRRYTLGGADPTAIAHLGGAAHDLIATLEHNIAVPPEARHFEDSAMSLGLDPAAIPLFRRLLRQRGAAFLEDIEGWMLEHEKPGSSDAVRAGVVLHMVVDAEPAAPATPAATRDD
ncbi:MAG: DUF6502 family protein [Gammaproteobacteria bacterium]